MTTPTPIWIFRRVALAVSKVDGTRRKRDEWVEAYVFASFAVHPTFTRDGSSPDVDWLWTVSHEPTGHLLCYASSEVAAREAAEAYARVRGVDWASLTPETSKAVFYALPDRTRDRIHAIGDRARVVRRAAVAAS